MDIFILQKIISDIREKSIKIDDVGIYIRNNYKDIDNIELISDCINLIQENIFEYTNIKELIYFFINSNVISNLYNKYRTSTRKYLASIILEWYKINPFDIINEIDNTHLFFSIFYNLADTFKMCNFIDNEYLILCLKKINNFSKNDMVFNHICIMTNEYISRDINISKYILKYFYENTDKDLYQFSLYSLNNILKLNKERSLNYLDFFLKSNIGLLEEFVFSFALFYIHEYKTIEYQYLKILIDKNDITNNDNIRYRITKIIFYVLEYKIFVNDYDLEKKLIGYINEYDTSKISILECLISISGINQFHLELLKISLEKLLVSELSVNQYYLINNIIDLIFYKFLDNGYFEEIFYIFKIFYLNNKNIIKNNINKYFESSIHILLAKYENDIIKKINENILKNKYELDFYIYILLHISYTEVYKYIDFTINLNKDDIIKYLLIIFINTIDLNLILQITTNILSGNIINDDIFEKFYIIFIRYIYMNYENKIMDYVESNKNNNSYFKILYDRINNSYIKRKNDIKKIFNIRDLKPSKERYIKYNIENNKKMKKEMEKVENQSPILNIVHNQYIKYGNRVNTVTNFDNKLNMHSMNFIEDTFSMPIPILYINDTCKFINDKYEIYKFVYGENNEINN
ncbi:hypothetical protein [uncultured Brachyspira sp.]|uniref:hypothetical protein n=1 Tax=uncultured Brachyspira sp. TaxID=221953 RepID=UPI002610D516|nr:hypothetical protein [uncultured Brachyspira sp.]